MKEMAKTLEEIIKAVEGLDEGAEFVAGLQVLSGEIKKKNSEAQNLRTRLKTAEDSISAVNGKFSKVAAFIGLEEEAEDLEVALEALKAKQKAGGGKEGGSPEIAELTSKLAQ